VKEIRKALKADGLTFAESEEAIGRLFASKNVQVVELGEDLEDTIVTLVEAPQGAPFIELVMTNPRSRVNLKSTLRTFQQLCTEAKHEICVLSPYVDLLGISMLKEELTSAATKGVSLRLITRDPERAAVEFLTAIFGPDCVRVLADRERHYQLHAKLLLVDKYMAYVGSAELRLNALVRNVEIGMVVQEKRIVSTLYALFETLWAVGNKWT
jgi:phosphatidylserine/phosphatidylglycerophosphate/cardiolipin synthase-like enzyme